MGFASWLRRAVGWLSCLSNEAALSPSTRNHSSANDTYHICHDKTKHFESNDAVMEKICPRSKADSICAQELLANQKVSREQAACLRPATFTASAGLQPATHHEPSPLSPNTCPQKMGSRSPLQDVVLSSSTSRANLVLPREEHCHGPETHASVLQGRQDVQLIKDLEQQSSKSAWTPPLENCLKRGDNWRQLSRRTNANASSRLPKRLSGRPIIFRSPFPPTSDSMSRDTLAETLNHFDEILGNDVPYLICGRAALAAWGYAARPSRISVICEAERCETLRAWARVKAATSNGLVIYHGRPDEFGLRTRDGVVRRVRIKYVDAGTNNLSGVRFDDEKARYYSGVFGTVIQSKANVLSLCSLLEIAAMAYIGDCQHEEGIATQRALGMDIIWILKRMADGSAARTHDPSLARELMHERGALSPQDVPHIMQPQFWDLFCCIYPGAEALLAAVGLTRAPKTVDVRDSNRASGFVLA